MVSHRSFISSALIRVYRRLIKIINWPQIKDICRFGIHKLLYLISGMILAWSMLSAVLTREPFSVDG